MIKDESPLDSRYGRKITDFINGLDHPRVLELGGGNGRFVRYIKNYGKYTVVDLSEYAFEVFPKEFDSKVEKKKEDLNGPLSFGKASFDVVFSTWTLEHVLKPKIFLSEQARISSMYVIILAPNLEIPWSVHNCIRHRTVLYKLKVQMKRIINLFSLLFGGTAFMTENHNISDEFSVYDEEDDDLRYYVGGTEVVRFMFSKGYDLIDYDNTIEGSGFKNTCKKIFRILSRMNFAGSPIYFVFKKSHA